MLNRSAVIVRPGKPLLDWIRAVDDDDAPPVRADDLGETLYLVPDYEDPADAERVLKRVYGEIFCRELEGWFTDMECWPRDRTFKKFKEWFEVEHLEVVEDVGRGPIENDEDPEERHRFDPEPPARPRPPKRSPKHPQRRPKKKPRE